MKKNSSFHQLTKGRFLWKLCGYPWMLFTYIDHILLNVSYIKRANVVHRIRKNKRKYLHSCYYWAIILQFSALFQPEKECINNRFHHRSLELCFVWMSLHLLKFDRNLLHGHIRCPNVSYSNNQIQWLLLTETGGNVYLWPSG